MKLVIVLGALLAVALAAPQHNPAEVVIVKRNELDNIGVNGYSFGYELSNGETREEVAEMKNLGAENEALVVRGSFSWVDPDTNVKYTVKYVADENGFHPEGAHIPAN